MKEVEELRGKYSFGKKSHRSNKTIETEINKVILDGEKDSGAKDTEERKGTNRAAIGIGPDYAKSTFNYENLNEGQRERLDMVFIKNHWHYWKLKRALDIFLSFFAIIGLSPIMLIICLAIVIDDPHGGPIYKQIRIGRHGDEFLMYKFRSMVVGADKVQEKLDAQNEKDGPVFKMKNDPRITRIGKVLRKTSLDELPQFFNILKGDMTIVGPRPPLPREVAQYNEYQQLRLMVTPGLTCKWQAQPNRDNVSFEEWMDMDMDYIGERTLVGDLKLIMKTIRSMAHGDGS